ncbi:MAG: prolipoprotein diacylglyceryl transferase [Lentisphaeria bacterium]|nr:prolipoprotein diacylglyceryl transferase [Lentisphaeria bacterium]
MELFYSQVIWDVSPQITASLPIRWYGLFFAISFMLGITLVAWQFKKEKVSVERIDNLLVFMVVCTMLGARLGECLFYHPAYYLQHPLEIVQIWKGGLASHGGVIGILVGLYFYRRLFLKEKSYLWLVDRLCIPNLLGASIVRLGNLMNSEIIGKTTDAPWGFIFRGPNQLRLDITIGEAYSKGVTLNDQDKLAILNEVRHPSQLYESITYFTIFLIFVIIYKKYYKVLPEGFLFGLTFVCVFTARFFLEFFKDSSTLAEYAQGSLSTGQLLSIPAVILGIALMVYSLKKNKKMEPPVEPEA